ncbi:hypothetical protein FDENT_7449 [Fusarium denticulatum]|uniref:Uncharacterized protein n=1 Tax=Fusarium denticulatum TaxID=48507 RepID=A0A8H5U5C5_9HYPO|nr:hypothetical protein FDENT_7449 [Fusarium denticulatum]
MPIIKGWGSTNAVDNEKLVFRHEFPVKRFCKMEKLREALGDIFGSDDWVVEYDGDSLIIKVGSRVDLKEELKARGIIYKAYYPRRLSQHLKSGDVASDVDLKPDRSGAHDAFAKEYLTALAFVTVYFPAVAFEFGVLVYFSSLFHIVRSMRQPVIPSPLQDLPNPSRDSDTWA